MDITWNKFHDLILKEAKKTKIPVSGFFELTARCNFRCKMCYVCNTDNTDYAKKNELSTEQWIRLGREAREAGLFFLTLTGGEIFLRKDFFEIYEAYTEMGFNIVLFTNGSLLDKERVKRLAQKPPSRVSITLYGANSDTYRNVTGNGDGYAKTINSIRLLKANNIPVDVKTTVVKYNKDEFEILAEQMKNLGITIGVVNYVSPRREGNDTDPLDCRLNPYELVLYEKKIREYNRYLDNEEYSENKSDPNKNHDRDGKKEVPKTGEVNTEAKDKTRFQLDEDTMQHMASEDKKHENTIVNTDNDAFRCISGKCGFWLAWDGKLYPCGLLSEPYTEPLKTGFLNAWEKQKQLCETVPVCNECRTCEFRSKCMTCPARLKAETGYFDRPAKYLCEHAELRIKLL